MIVGSDSEVEMLNRCLGSVVPYVDRAFITITQTPNKKLQKLANQYGASFDIRVGEFNYNVGEKEVKWLEKYLGYKPNVKVGDALFQFDKARNANLDSIPDEFDWYFWIDTDDILRNGQMLKTSADEALARGEEAIFYNYLYQVELEEDKVKNVIIQHLRERLVRISGEYRKVFKWVGSVHETLVQQRETKRGGDERLDIIHFSSPERMKEALVRNMKILEIEIFKKEGRDPRPLYYLGKAYFDIHTDEARSRAEKLILTYLSPNMHSKNMSGWKEERSQAWEYLGEIYRERREFNNANKALHNALIEYPQFPSTYFSLAVTSMLKEEWDTARFWAIMGSKIPPAKSTLVSNPRDLQARAYEVIYNAGIKLNKVDEAWAACQRLKELFPTDPRIEQQWQFINETREIRDQLKNYAGLVSYLNRTGQQAKIRPLLSAAPAAIVDNPVIIKLRQELYPPKEWQENEIAIYCGPQFTPWGPESIKDPGQTFVGGSEEAVIYLSKELAKLGWKVVIYADPQKEEVIDGVEWLSHYKFNPKDKFNIIVAWRAVSFADLIHDAKKVYLWTHDVQQPLEYKKERLDKITKIIALSKAHRKNLPDIPDDKFIISSNGYHEHYPKLKPKNNPKWCIWTSSYDRGLENLLNIWPEVVKEVPKAQLHIFYGWQLFKHFYRGNPERMSWMRKMEKLMQAKGITDHGRVPQPEMEKWYKKCGIWTYPTHFYEINCISAIKAQLWGSVPVVISHAALKETVKYGIKVEGEINENVSLTPETEEKYKQALIKALKDEKWQDEQRERMMPWARGKYSWEKIAQSWSKEFGGVRNG